MARLKDTTKIHAAATYFAFVSRNIEDIAQAFDVETRTVRRWAKDAEWQDALQACRYTGNRRFETKPYRDTQRDSGDVFTQARTTYLQAMTEGVPKHKLATVTALKVGINHKTIRRWAKEYNWREDAETQTAD